jgi:hypothetical protein
MKVLGFIGLLLIFLAWAASSSAARCTVGAPFDEDGCQTTSVPNPQGDFQILSCG